MAYTVELSAEAQANIQEVYAYIQQRGPADPDRWRAGLERKLISLENIPESCGLAPESLSTRAEIRQLLYGLYRILFTIRSMSVYVLAFRHAARRAVSPKELDSLGSEE